MDGDQSQLTQQATQNVVDPRRLGQQNSGFTDEDMADIICLLVPYSPKARSEAARLAREGSPFVIGREEAETVDVDYALEDSADRFSLSAAGRGSGPAFVLRLSATVKNPLQGFTFGRNAGRCDICFTSDALRRLSNIHFRVFINEYKVLMVQDLSTNGTVVDEVLLKSHRHGVSNMRTLSSGTKIEVLLQHNAHDLSFLVRVPRRHGAYEAAYERNVDAYQSRLRALALAQGVISSPPPAATPQAIVAGPGGHVDLFRQPPARDATPGTPPATAFVPAVTNGLPREWNGSDSYNRIGEIGKGAFATVHKVTAKYDGRPYAAKELDKRRFVKNGVIDQKAENEMRIMQRIHHPSIVRYIEHFEFDERLLIIIMEYVPGGDLGTYIANHGPLSEVTVQAITRQLLDALDYLHDKNITHRDIKPDNILIETDAPFTVKLTDFGLSKMVDNEQTFLRTFCGTLLYCAPEVYAEYCEYDEQGRRTIRHRKDRRPPGQLYSHAVDIWSLAGVLFYCLTKSPPFPVRQGTSHTELLNRIMTRPLDIQPLIRAGVSAACVDFLTQMLQRRPEHRATVQTLLNHPWLGGSGRSADVLTNSLEQSASQLTIHDRLAPDPEIDEQRLGQIGESDDEFLDDDDENVDGDDLLGGESQFQDLLPDFDMDAASEKENGGPSDDPSQQPLLPRPAPPRLFGEVDISAIGSSGVIPEDRIHLPIPVFDSQDNMAYESFPSGACDSLQAEHSTLTQQQQQQQQEEELIKWSQPREHAELGREDTGLTDHDGGHLPASLASRNFEDSQTVDEISNLTFDAASQSLGGAESILGNLNMKSVAVPPNFKHSVSDFTGSKRKPALDTSDEFDGGTIKRLRSESHIHNAASRSVENDHDDTDEDAELYAAVQPISRSKTGRQMDLPVHKSVYWTPGAPESWHLQYPEMTQLQYDVFDDAAAVRGEEFRPGRSKLWRLAMKHFPPTTAAAGAESECRSPSGSQTESVPQSRSRSTSHISDAVSALPTTAGATDEEVDEDDSSSSEMKENRRPRTASPHAELPSTAPAPTPSSQIIVPVMAKPTASTTRAAAAEVASFASVPTSVVQNIRVPVTECVTRWGRSPDNTQVYVPRNELKVPKNAFRLLLWRSDADPAPAPAHGDGHGPSGHRLRDAYHHPKGLLRPWEQLADGASPAARRYHFYISTKARNGINVNQTHIPSVDPGNPQSAARYWLRLHDGDSVAVWHNFAAESNNDNNDNNSEPPQRTALVFRCSWGGSAVPRETAAAVEDEATGRRLDDACQRAERSATEMAAQQVHMAAADRDVAERTLRLDRERARSATFAARRAAVCARHHKHQQQLLSRQLQPFGASAMAASRSRALSPANGGVGVGGSSINIIASSSHAIDPSPNKPRLVRHG